MENGFLSNRVESSGADCRGRSRLSIQAGVFGPVIRPTGNYSDDMKPAFAFFRTIVPRHPERGAFPDGF